jgi:coatomer subunit beta
VRRNSVLAIYNTYKCFEDLMPDAPEVIGEFIDGESDVSAKRNAFVMLCNCDQERAVQYQLSVIDQIASMGDIIQLNMLELIRKVCRQDPYQKSKYVRAVFGLQSSASNSVAFECASTLVSLSTAQTAVRTAVQAYCALLSTHSDNNVKLVVLDKLSELQKKHPDVLKTMIMDIIRGLSSPNIDIKKKVLDLVMELVTPASIDEVISVLKKEIVKTQSGDVEKTTEYRQMLVQVFCPFTARATTNSRCSTRVFLGLNEYSVCVCVRQRVRRKRASKRERRRMRRMRWREMHFDGQWRKGRG